MKDSSPNDSGPEREISAAPSRLNGLRAHPIGDMPSPVAERPPKSPTSIKSHRSRVVGQARDARAGSDSVRDIADFLRSTAPPGAVNQPSTSPTTSTNGSLRTQYRDASGSVVTSGSKSPIARRTSKPQDPEPSARAGPRFSALSPGTDQGKIAISFFHPPKDPVSAAAIMI